jgi:transposase
MNLSQRLRLVELDKKQWQRLYYKNQQEYIRQRLSAIRYLSEGKSRAEVAQLLGCTDLTIAKWMGKYLETGLAGLVEPIKHQVKERLNPEQQQQIKEMVLNDRPTKYGIDREIWTGKIIAFVIKQRWEVDLKTSRIYEILDNLNLSHQKAHRDYENADPGEQKKFVKILKKNAPEKDNNSTHKDKLRHYLWAELFTSGIDEQITVEFVYTPPYSPNFNLVEYLIHLLRLRLLHHLPSGTSIKQVEMRLKTFFETQQLQTPIQISNTIQHIYNLIL